MESRANQEASAGSVAASEAVRGGGGVDIRATPEPQRSPESEVGAPGAQGQTVDLGREFVAHGVPVIRGFPSDAWSFITSSWLKSYRNSGFAKHIPSSIYFAAHHAVL